MYLLCLLLQRHQSSVHNPYTKALKISSVPVSVPLERAELFGVATKGTLSFLLNFLTNATPVKKLQYRE